jgi:hypothetical protein
MMTRPAGGPVVVAKAPDGALFPKDVAALAKVKAVATIHKYNSIAARNRDAGTPGPRDMPAPDGWQRATHGPPAPWWMPDTIRPWLEARWNPGRPADGGTASAAPSAKTGAAKRRAAS